MDADPVGLTRQTYDQIAARFASFNADMPEMVARMAARLVAQVRPGERILDLGCGPGRDLAWFEANGARLTGVDLSAGMLAEARSAARSGLCQMEMRQLGFADGSFTGVWCNAALLHLPKREAPAALAEIRRVLAQGGRCFLSVQQGRGEGVETGPLDDMERFFARYQPGEVAGLLEEAGFSILSQEIQPDGGRPGRVWIWHETLRQAGAQ